MRAILMDVGNTRIRVKGLVGQVEPVSVIGKPELSRFNDSPLESLAEFSTSKFLSGDGKTLTNLAEIRMGKLPFAVVSVVPQVTGKLQDLWPDLIVIDHKCDLPFESLVPDLSAVGPDRLCNVAGAIWAGLNNALIVDAGTATTFDILEDGVFAGGLIAPGMAFAAQQLGELAARLDPVPFGPCPLEPGIDTQEAMARGCWHCGIGGVESIICEFMKVRPHFQVILTGGLGHFLAGEGRVVDSEWTLRGAIQLAGFCY